MSNLIRPGSFTLLFFQYSTGMFLRYLIIINSHQEKISLIFFKCRYISFFFDLIYRTISIFIPFQMNFSSGIFFYSRLLHNKAPLCNLL